MTPPTAKAGVDNVDLGTFVCIRHGHGDSATCTNSSNFPRNDYTSGSITYTLSGHRHGSSTIVATTCLFDSSGNGPCNTWNCSGDQCGHEYGGEHPYNIYTGGGHNVTTSGIITAYRNLFVEDAEAGLHISGSGFYPDAPPPPPPPDCLPDSQSTTVDTDIFIDVAFGLGTYSWSAPGGNPSSDNDPNFRTRYSAPGNYSVVVTTDGGTDTCTVSVSGSGGGSPPPAPPPGPPPGPLPPPPPPQPNLYVNNVQLRVNGTNCSNGTLVTDGMTVSSGANMEVCINWGNNGSTATSSSGFWIESYRNQASQPANGTTGQVSHRFTSSLGVGSGPFSQFYSIVADSASCSSNCRVGVFVDRNNEINNESNEGDNFATSVRYNVASGPSTADIRANGSNGPVTVPYNSSATITWSSTGASSCFVVPSGWTGTSGSQSSGNLTTNRTYTLDCVGAGGNSSDSVDIYIAPTDASGIQLESSACGQLSFSWIDNSNNESGFAVYYRNSSSGPNIHIGDDDPSGGSGSRTTTYTWSNPPATPVWIVVRPFIDYGGGNIVYGSETVSSTSYTPTTCFVNMSNSRKDIAFVNGNAFDRTIPGKDTDRVTFRIQIRNSGTDNVQITGINDIFHPNPADDGGRPIQLTRPTRFPSGVTCSGNACWNLRVDKDADGIYNESSAQENGYSMSGTIPNLTINVTGLKCTTANHANCTAVGGPSVRDPSCPNASLCNDWVILFDTIVALSEPTLKTDVWNEARVNYTYLGTPGFVDLLSQR
ncbi:MAG TPA: hypothetical protein VEC17_03465, partial [Candidatus Binatia bacterium]|nr:hypothetical protein [Candidatus Binatia bacterium]